MVAGSWLLVAGAPLARSGPGSGSGSGPALSGIPEGACACGAEGRMASIGPVGPRCQGLCRRVASLRSGERPWWAPFKKKGRHYDKTFTTALTGERKQANRPSGDGNAPLSPPAAVLPPKGGSLLSAFFSANLSSSLYSAARTSPSGGSGGASHR